MIYFCSTRSYGNRGSAVCSTAIHGWSRARLHIEAKLKALTWAGFPDEPSINWVPEEVMRSEGDWREIDNTTFRVMIDLKVTGARTL